MEKSQELEHGCMAKAADDEPVFVLRAQDKIAPIVVRLWAQMALLHGLPDGKALEAMHLANKMEDWPTRKFPD